MVVILGLISILLATGVLTALFAAPVTFLLMLFLGNIGLSVSFWGALPGGLIVSALASRVTVNKE